MVWFKIDDGFWSHPKVLELSDAALALWVRAGSYCAQQLTDGHVTRAALRMLGGNHDAAVELVIAGLWDEAEGGNGWVFHDWDDYQPTREQVMEQRAKEALRQELSRNPQLRDAIRSRDGDRCRYCGRAVNWADRKSPAGGTYDHVDPHGANTFENLVVACRGCISRKGSRTPAEAGMTLIVSRSRSGSDLVTNLAPTRPDPTIKRGVADRAPVAVQIDAAAPSPFCPRHPNGTDDPCIPCRNARLAYEAAREAERRKPTPTPSRPPMCPIHDEYPLPCDRCKREAAEAKSDQEVVA